MKILDILLYPKSLFTKITDKKLTLFLGVLLVGIVDAALNMGITELPKYFTGDIHKANFFNFAVPALIAGFPAALVLSLVYTIILVILLGVLDVLFFTVPIHDLFKFLTSKFKLSNTGSLVKIAKIYVMTHIIIIPINVIVILLIFHYNLIELNNPFILYPIEIYLDILMPIWFSAIIVRGINVLYNIDIRFKGLVFLGVYIWNYLLGVALGLVGGFLIGLLFK